VLGHGLAEVRLAREAVPARPTGWNEAESNVVARRNVCDALADRFHHSSPLVPHDRRPTTRPEVAVGVADVGVTDAGSGYAHQYLPRFGRIELDLLDLDGLTGVT
jgi:hypothetical protein